MHKFLNDQQTQVTRQKNRINIDRKMRRHGCGAAAESWKPDLEKERKKSVGWIGKRKQEGGTHQLYKPAK